MAVLLVVYFCCVLLFAFLLFEKRTRNWLMRAENGIGYRALCVYDRYVVDKASFVLGVAIGGALVAGRIGVRAVLLGVKVVMLYAFMVERWV